MELIPGFMLLLQGLSATMPAPSFSSLTTILTGWVFANRHTVTRMILAAGDVADKHFSSDHRASFLNCFRNPPRSSILSEISPFPISFG